ncbi:hypothetical protein WBP07_12030 [Novosphingobium sp. BL-8A]|uniref:hypothetical protein n=1 Tax=Novosphingobium sp. BL-8A TaxID=3127639 RepID=UPI003757AAE1
MTEYWFRTIVLPMIRTAAKEAEVHIIAPPGPWRLTGLTDAMLKTCLYMPELHWHILDDADHTSYRTRPASRDDFVDFVRQIDADYTFCRSADVETPARFPGKVRFIMEATFMPLVPDHMPFHEWVMIHDGRGLYDHGMLPALTEAQHVLLREHIRPIWDSLVASGGDCPLVRDTYLTAAGLPTDRKIIAVPLEYDGPENFFNVLHGIGMTNDKLVAALAEQIDDDSLLAITVHPIQQQYNPTAVQRIADMDPAKVRIVRGPGRRNLLTSGLLRHCDGAIVQDSKSIINAAFFEKPILRLSRFATADWLNVYDDTTSFLTDIAAGTARAPSREDAMTWLGYHHANNALAANELPDEGLKALLDRVDRPVDPARWEANLARHAESFVDWLTNGSMPATTQAAA